MGGSEFARLDLDSSPFFAQELISVLLGCKPVASAAAREKDLPALRCLAKKLDLRHLVLGPQQRGGLRRDGDEPFVDVLIGKRSGTVAQAADFWRRRDSARFNQLLGYPPCCVKAYAAWNALNARSPSSDIVPFIRAASGPGPYPFLLNSLFIFSSRLFRHDHSALLDRMVRLNRQPGTPGWRLDSIISWHPCSFRCRPSLDIAKNIWTFLETRLPHQAARFKGRLARPILFLDWAAFAVLDGRATRTSVEYSGIVPPFSLLPREILDALRRGESLRLTPGGVAVRRNAKTVASISAKSPLLLEFV